jgi:hypothetical protein
MIEDSGIVDCCCILVEWLFMPKEYVTVAPLFDARSWRHKTAVKDQTCYPNEREMIDRVVYM